MAGTRMRMEVRSAEAKRYLSALVERGQNLREPFDEIGASLVTSTQQRFESEEDPDGQAWPELAIGTTTRRLSARRRRGPDHILRERGLLFASLTHLATDRDLNVGAGRVYAAIHQLGGESDMAPGPASIPARPFLGVSDDDEREIEALLLEYLGAPT